MKKIIALIIIIIIAIALILIFVNKENADISTNNPPNSAENAPSGSIHNLPIPPGVAAAKNALASRLTISESSILILEAIETEWSDACLGIREEGIGCAQMITSGYAILMQANGKEYRYRTNLSGSVVKAEN